MEYSHIAIIYNPKSSGRSPRIAQELYTHIRNEMPRMSIEVLPTKYAGHAKDLAEIVGRTRYKALILSIGGDGTYHEVVNGIMKLPASARPMCMVVGAGNANDHERERNTRRPIMERLKYPKFEPVDLLKVVSMNPVGADIRRYAHSYVGFGMSGRVADALNRETKGQISEKVIVMRELMKPESFEIIHDKAVKRLFSLLATNVQIMAKHLNLAKDDHVKGPGFAVIETPTMSRSQLLREVVKATAGDHHPTHVTKHYLFMLITPVQAQMDGETMSLAAGSTVTITEEMGAFYTLA